MDLNTKVFLKINAPVGKSKLLDSFGRAGAEWVILAMLGWYITSDLVYSLPDKNRVIWQLAYLLFAWSLGWLISLALGLTVQESRPYISAPQTKTLFKPLMSWKSFPSDHAMSATVIFLMAIFLNFVGAWALLPMGLWVVWGRVYSGLHYPLDILGGIAVGVFASLVIKLFI